MNRKNKFLILLAVLFVFSTLAFAVSAAEEAKTTGVFGAVLTPFGKFDQVYEKFGIFIDAGIYLIIFLGLTQISLGRLWKDRAGGGKAISVGIAIVLALSLTLFEKQAGFNIASFGPIAALMLIALMGYAIWAGIKAMDVGADNTTMAAIAFIVVYFSLQAVTPNIMAWIAEKVPIVGAILALIALIFTIYIFYKLITWMMSMFGGGAGGETPVSAHEARGAGRRVEHPGALEDDKGKKSGKDEADVVIKYIQKAKKNLADLHGKLQVSVKDEDKDEYKRGLLAILKDLEDNLKQAWHQARRVHISKKEYISEAEPVFEVARDALETQKELKTLKKYIGSLSIEEAKEEVKQIAEFLKTPLSKMIEHSR